MYETRCLTCDKNENDTINGMDIEEYIGETSRSAFERGWEHLNDLAQLRTSSHMLKHIEGVHPDQDMSDIKFGMEVIKYTHTSFDRQVRESVLIQEERNHHSLLN